MSQQQDLATLLATGERAVFHGRPPAAVAALESAVQVAHGQNRSAEATAATWLLGVAFAAIGSYGHTFELLDPLVAAGAGSPAPEQRLFASLAGSTSASVHRQLGRHGVAREADLAALDSTAGVGEAAFDAFLGLAADAIGLNQPDEARGYLDQATGLLPHTMGGNAPAGAGEWWRQQVLLDWGRAEFALLVDDPSQAVGYATAAVDRAEAARAPWHVAKGLLFLGVAQSQLRMPDAVPTLRRATALAEGLGALPLVWPSSAVLSGLLAEQGPEESERRLAAARATIRAIADDLPDPLSREWLARDDIAALVRT